METFDGTSPLVQMQRWNNGEGNKIGYSSKGAYPTLYVEPDIIAIGF